MEALTILFTRRDYAALPEGFPAQLLEGVLVKTPGPRPGHQAIASRIHVALARLVGPGRALFAPVDVAVDEWNVYQPDLVNDRDFAALPDFGSSAPWNATRHEDGVRRLPFELGNGRSWSWHRRKGVRRAGGVHHVRCGYVPLARTVRRCGLFAL